MSAGREQAYLAEREALLFDMRHWYPTRSRVDALERELASLERIAATEAAGDGDYVSGLSAALTNAARLPGFPKHQVARWIWVASQFRIHEAARDSVRTECLAALLFLGKRIASGEIDECVVQDLNWVLDSAIRRISRNVTVEELRSCLSSEELERIDRRLIELDEMSAFDVDAVRVSVRTQLSAMESFCDLVGFADLQAKIDALFETATGEKGEFRIARAALSYLADRDDVVSDRLGILGLIDDIYVIELAYAVVESQTRCLPILEALIRKWPFVADLALLDRGRAPLDRFGQYVACAVLESEFGGKPGGLLVVRETGAYPIIAAVMTAVECGRRQSRELDAETAAWQAGQALVIGDGVETFQAEFRGISDLNGRRFRLGVRDSGIIHVGEEVLPYMAAVPGPHRRLSSGTKIAEWLKDRHLDPLVNLIGTGRRRSLRHEAVLLLGPRHKLEEMMGGVRPFGVTPPALLGMRYVKAGHDVSDVKGSTSERPLIYACSDATVAADLLEAPPAHVSGWKIIVDGARSGKTFLQAVDASSAVVDSPICVVGELHEREAAAELVRLGSDRVWYLEDQDIEAPRSVRPPDMSTDIVQRMLGRRSAHWFSTRTIHEVEAPFLEAVIAELQKRDRGAEEDDESLGLDLAVSAFVQKALSHVLPGPRELGELASLARSVAAQASVLRQFDERAARFHALFGGASEDASLANDRRETLRELVDATDEESVAVVCRSEEIAKRCRTVAREDEVLARADWVNVAGLRRGAPYGRVVVPAWLDRLAMRELALSGYAPCLDFVLSAAERRWFEKTVGAIRRWERRLELRTAERLAEVADAMSETGAMSPGWREQTRMRLAKTSGAIEDDATFEDDEPAVDKLEERAVEAMSRSVASLGKGEARGAAQLVLFESPGHFALLAPRSSTIVLAGGDTGTEKGRGRSAERTLKRPVSELAPGMVLAFSSGGERDLIDFKADEFLSDAGSVRRRASLWKSALRRQVGTDDIRIEELCRRMSEAGHARDRATIRYWISYDHTIAPRGFRAVVPLLAELTGDAELKAGLKDTLQAIDLIYRARAQAAEVIVNQLSSGEIDIASSTLKYRAGGVEVVYELHRIRRLADVLRVPVELIGKVGSLSALPKAAA